MHIECHVSCFFTVQPKRADGKGRLGLSEIVFYVVSVHQAIVEECLLDGFHRFMEIDVVGIDKAIMLHEQQ